MNAAIIRDFIKAEPFRPFEVHVTDGGRHLIGHPELGVLSQNTLAIGIDGPSSEAVRFCHVALLHISTIRPLPPTRPEQMPNGHGQNKP